MDLKSGLRYTDRYDFIIGTLYSLKTSGKSGFFSLKELLEKIGYKTDYDEVFQVGKYLEAKGYVNAMFVIGDALLEIKPNGIIYWEDKLDKFPKKFNEFVNSKNLQTAINEVVSTFEQEDFIKKTRSDIFVSLEIILEKLSQFKDQNPDLYIDGEILKLELHKTQPDKEILLNKLYSLDHILPIQKELMMIKRILNV